MAITLVQSKTMVGQDGSSGSVQLAFDAAPTAGNLVVVVVFWNHTGAESASSVNSTNDTLAEIAGATIYSANIAQNLSIWSKGGIVGGASSQTLTATFAANRTFRKLWLGEYAGAATSSQVDAVAEAADVTTGAPDAGTLSPTQDNDLCISVAGSDTAAPTAAGGAGWSSLEADAGYYFSVAHQIQTTATQRTTFWTAPTTSNAWAAVAASFKVAVAGGGDVISPYYSHYYVPQIVQAA